MDAISCSDLYDLIQTLIKNAYFLKNDSMYPSA